MKMNRTPMLLVSLLGLLMSQQAQAFYNPSTGKWISRDPMGDNAFVQFYAAQESGGNSKEVLSRPYTEPCYPFVVNRPNQFVDASGLTVYFCNGVIRTYVHSWVCLGTNNCAGLMPYDGRWWRTLCCSGKGRIEAEKYHPNKCKAVDVAGTPDCDQSKYEKCIETNLIVGKEEKFGIFFANCASWAKGLILHCQAEACGTNGGGPTGPP